MNYLADARLNQIRRKLTGFQGHAFRHSQLLARHCGPAGSFFHIRSTLVVPFDSFDVHNALARAFFAITAFGHDAVIVVFVLSGYLVGGAVLRLNVRASHDLWVYWFDRSVRIGPVLIAATVLSVTLQHLAPASGRSDTPATVLGNALGFQIFLVRPLCNNLSLWSISNEVVYYLPSRR